MGGKGLPESRLCLECGGRLPVKYNLDGTLTKKGRKKFCSDACINMSAKRADNAANPEKNASRGSIGAASELLVASQLLNSGHSVFRSVSPNAVCDILVISSSGDFFRLEVTTTRRSRHGHILFPARKLKDADRWDILAVVHGSDVCYYDALRNLLSVNSLQQEK